MDNNNDNSCEFIKADGTRCRGTRLRGDNMRFCRMHKDAKVKCANCDNSVEKGSELCHACSSDSSNTEGFQENNEPAVVQSQPQPQSDIMQRGLAAIQQERASIAELAKFGYQAQQNMLTLTMFSQENAEMVKHTVRELNNLTEREGSFVKGAHQTFLDMGGGSKKSFLDWC